VLTDAGFRGRSFSFFIALASTRKPLIGDSNDSPVGVEVLIDEPSLLVINKPTGLLCQSTFGVDSAIFRVRSWLSEKSTSVTPFAELVHRIDRGTSGILLIARNRRTLQLLSAQFASRKVRKTYIGWVSGKVEPSLGEWTDTMRKIPDVAKAERCSAEIDGARQAILAYQVLESNDRFSRVQIELKTGRTHQIRLQFAGRGFPIVGDRLYGSQDSWDPLPQHAHDEHFALHARELVFRDPNNGRERRIEAPFPVAWAKFGGAEANECGKIKK
jgi:23S rRNA pseudouridine1911/1915/1917 synthase